LGAEDSREVVAGSAVLGGSSGAASKCSMSSVGTSTKFDPSALMKSRVKSPITSRRSCTIEKPFFNTATSPAKQGSAINSVMSRTRLIVDFTICNSVARYPMTSSRAAATPQASLPRVTRQPRALSSSHALPMITGCPANSSISTSLWLSPTAMTSSR
jgi:hypothetical protein